MSATVTSDKPAQRMTLSLISVAMASNCSSRRHFGIDAVQLPQVDLLDAEPPAARMRLLDQIFRPPERNPDVRAGAREPALGRDLNLAVGRKRFAYQLFGKVRAVGVRGVDEVDAEIGQPAQRLQHLGAIGRRTPDSTADDAHRAEAETIDVEGAANAKAAGFSGVDHGSSPKSLLSALTASWPAAASRIESTIYCRRSSSQRSCRDHR